MCGRNYFGSWFQKFQFIIAGAGGGMGTAHIMEARKQRENALYLRLLPHPSFSDSTGV
jgi:hypothetical protein